LLAFLQGESGGDVVEEALLAGGVCGAANWSETALKTRQRGADWSLARGLLESYGLTVEPVDADDAVRAAFLWESGSPSPWVIAFASPRENDWTPPSGPVDAAWGSSAQIRQVR
jgi:hypothetical protein